MSILSSLQKISKKGSKRLGRGYGSGKGGHTSSRGQKGQKARTGSKVPLWFEGGALPLSKRIPMWRGKGRFNSLHQVAELTFDDLNKIELTDITLDSLKLNRIIDKRFKKAKVIAKGKLNKKVHLKGIAVSATAKKEIEALFGSIKD
ncbi:MAG TPA: 50S ribosomal protein L15 [Candidatus Woesebacteria bacterium]|nr:50S ribosomal protein L15 [Candidatus Woesebacteria bacterium]